MFSAVQVQQLGHHLVKVLNTLYKGQLTCTYWKLIILKYI